MGENVEKNLSQASRAEQENNQQSMPRTQDKFEPISYLSELKIPQK